MKKRRTKIDIVNDILNVIAQNKGRIKQTHLMYKVNLSHKLMKSYLEDLISKEIIEEKPGTHNIYILMKDKGQDFLAKLKKMQEFQNAFGL